MRHIATQLLEVSAAIKAATLASNRQPETVRLVAVSKTYPVEAVEAAYLAGQRDFGENRPQELKAKAEYFREKGGFEEICWHLIGQLQKNKVKYVVPFVSLIHSVDSEELLAEIEKQAAKLDKQLNILLQINISDEAQKSGMDEAEAELILANWHYPHLYVQGLMGMASFTDDHSLIRRQFGRLRVFAEKMQQRFAGHSQIRFRELSMGMSGDYALAIAEGATMVRIGTAIFGERG